MKVTMPQGKPRFKGWGNRLYTWEELQSHITKEYEPFRQVVLGNWTSTCKRMHLNSFLTQYTNINSKRIIGLNVGIKTVKFLGENTGKSSRHWVRQLFLRYNTKIQHQKKKKNIKKTSKSKLFVFQRTPPRE